MKIDLAKAVDVSKWLHKAPSGIYLVGVELEGGWAKYPPKITSLAHDGSVIIEPMVPEALAGEDLIGQVNNTTILFRHRDTLAERMAKFVSYKSGEIPSPPLEPKDVEKWVTDYYPHKVNETCGLHVHMSFKSALRYSRLMVPEYPATVIMELTRWAQEERLPSSHPFWARISGKSQFCKLEFYPDEQAIKAKDHNQNGIGNRYTVINYCFRSHSTIECRVLPMFDDASQSFRAIKRLLDITSAFLATVHDRSSVAKQIEALMPLDVDDRRERSIYA